MLSLKVKPFVILTGNSGTGKTKLSQLFAKFLLIEEVNNENLLLDNNPYFNNEISSSDDLFADEAYLSFKSKASDFHWGENFFVVREEDLNSYIPVGIFDREITVRMGDIVSTARINLFPQMYYPDNLGINSSYSNSDSTFDIKIDLKSLDEVFVSDFEFIKDEISFNVFISEHSIDSKSFYLSIETFFKDFPFKRLTPCHVFIGDFETNANLQFTPQLFFDSDELKEFLKENKNERLELIVDCSDIKGALESFTEDNNLKGEFNNLNGSSGLNNQYADYNTDSDLKNHPSSDELGIKYKDEKNYKIIPVGANWTENRNIVGYYNVIIDDYQSTPAYELITQAQKHLEEPHFLILDEMNLSHVERYFADFLSAIESGEKIPLYGKGDLKIPDSLFIIGTVNVDETTYMFSPKVLDRANVLEFDTYPADKYMEKKIDLNQFNEDLDFEYLFNPLSDLNIRSMSVDKLVSQFEGVKAYDEDFIIVLSEEIDKFQRILEKSGFEFGFRVINEILRFMIVAWKYEGKPRNWTNWERYFDAQIKQKMLPKLHGSQKLIGDTILALRRACLTDYGFKKYPKSFKKLDEMNDVLDKQRYVSFIN